MKAILTKSIMVITFFLGNYMSAQTIISGTVTDHSNVPLPGVTVMEEGTNNGTVTDFDGQYSLTLNSDNTTLMFSYIGFSTQSINVSGQSTINVSMEENQQILDEVVVVGYGKMKKSDLTGAVSSVSSEQLERFPKVNAADALQGQ